LKPRGTKQAGFAACVYLGLNADEAGRLTGNGFDRPMRMVAKRKSPTNFDLERRARRASSIAGAIRGAMVGGRPR
jgi:hypothetical protein